MPDVVKESERCLLCKTPRCVAACPASTEIPRIIKLFKENKLMEAGEILFKNNPLSSVCGLICSHETQCKGNCILGIKGEGLDFGDIEHYISSFYLDRMKLEKEESKNQSIAIIGGGPAGITIAFILTQKGFDVTIFESHDKIGGVLRYGIPEFRLPKSLIDKLEEKLVEAGVKIRPNISIGSTITVEDIFSDGYEAVFIGTGTWKPNRLRIKGESLGDTHFAVNYLKNPDVYRLGKSIAIIGAGNVAMDAARTAVRHGVEKVTILFRDAEEFIEAREHEVKYAKLDGVEFLYHVGPTEITSNGVKIVDVEKTVSDEGYSLFTPIEGSERLFESDSVIISVSQGPKSRIVSNTDNIEVNERGLIVTDKTGNTTMPGVFSGGDVVTGAKTVVEAVNISRIIAENIEKYLNSKK
jgi:glutamate synthase (NADPH/NADH) small chain